MRRWWLRWPRRWPAGLVDTDRRDYNGESVDGFTSKDVRELQDEAHREGMIGISPVCIRHIHPKG